MFTTVQQGEEIVVYYLGKFHNIRGPGITVLLPGEKIFQRLKVREKQWSVPIPGLFPRGIPVDLMLYFRARLDIRACTLDNRTLRAELASWNPWQRQEKVDNTARRIATQVIADYEKEHPFPSNTDFFTQLEHILPGLKGNKIVCQEIYRRLVPALQQLGLVLSGESTLWTGIDAIDSNLAAAFSRARSQRVDVQRWQHIFTALEPHLKDLPPNLRTYVLALLSGSEPPNTNIIQLGAAGQDANLSAKIKAGTEGNVRTDIEYNTPISAAYPDTSFIPERSPTTPATASSTPFILLTWEDVALVKEIPSINAKRRQAG